MSVYVLIAFFSANTAQFVFKNQADCQKGRAFIQKNYKGTTLMECIKVKKK